MMDTAVPTMKTESQPITRHIGVFVHETLFSDLPAEAVRRAKNSFLDTLGVALGGISEPAPQLLCRFVREQGDCEHASVLAQGLKTSVPYAALINGTAGDIVGWSDISVTQMTHPSVSICPAVWAIGEHIRAPGKEVLLAHVLGLEVANKLGAGVKPGLQLKGWHPLAVLNTFGCAIAGGKLLGLDVDGLCNALGIAGAEASGMRVAMGSMSKAYGAGRAARDGVTAALLANIGYTGPVNVIEGRDGFLQTFGDGASGAGILEQLGNPFEFVSPGITLKKFPACTRSHNGIQGLLNLREQYSFGSGDIAKVECLVTPAVVDYLKFPRPKNKFEAKYSMEFCIATAIRDGTVLISSFTDERVCNPELAALMEKITMTVWPEYAKDGYNPSYAPYGCVVQVTLKDGRKLVERVDKGPWEPSTPPGWDDLVPKFRSNAEMVLDKNIVDQVVETVACLETLEDISELVTLVSNGQRANGKNTATAFR
jgi:2-methylcitrate dehydratase PrpD